MQHRLAPVFERYISRRNRVDNFRGGILGDAEESLRLTRQGYQAGELSFLNLLTAQRTYFQANLNYVEALCSMWAASTEIEGMLLTNSLEMGEAPSRTSEPVFSPSSNPGLPSMAGQL
jgi:cobalt-zinc-cadmium efflux system outer membrane protein